MTTSTSVRAMPLTKRSVADTVRAVMDEYWQAVGARVAALREAKGWSQEELAQRARVSSKTIWRVEKGRHALRGGTGRQLAEALEVDLSEILGAPPAPLGLGGDTGPSQLDRIESMLAELLGRVARLEELTPSAGELLEDAIGSGGQPPRQRDDDSEEDEPEPRAEGD